MRYGKFKVSCRDGDDRSAVLLKIPGESYRVVPVATELPLKEAEVLARILNYMLEASEGRMTGEGINLVRSPRYGKDQHPS